jgi:hypothetical protein
MLKPFVLITSVIITSWGPVVTAQAPPDRQRSEHALQQPAPEPLQTPKPGGQTPTPRAPQPEEPRRPAFRRQPVNLKIDVTISDQRGSGAPITKVVSLTVADGEFGRIRSQVEVPIFATENSPMRSVPLNVDARPEIVDGKIRLGLTIELEIVDMSVERGTRPKTEITETMSVILENGRPLVVSQSADPISDRKVSVEVRATILK